MEKICERCDVAFTNVVEDAGERLGKDNAYLLDSGSIRETFGWNDQISLEDGFSETLAWVDSHLDLLRSLPWTYKHRV